MSYQEYTVKVFSDRTEWYQNGQLHRLDGPAIEYPNGDKRWYQNDQLHRLDGPAIEFSNGTKEWYINSVRFTENEFNKQVKVMQTPATCNDKTVEIEGVKYKLTLIKD
jgi:hypothetical protein